MDFDKPVQFRLVKRLPAMFGHSVNIFLMLKIEHGCIRLVLVWWEMPDNEWYKQVSVAPDCMQIVSSTEYLR